MVSMGEWDMNISTTPEHFSLKAIEQAHEFIARWVQVFPKGETWVGKEYGVPSLIVRFDCIINKEGKLQVYELEERPCGIGVTSHLVPQFGRELKAIRKTWPHFLWVEAKNRITDDAFWLGTPRTLAEAERMDELVLVRSRPSDKDFHKLESRAVSSVRHEGDKTYGEAMGLWSRAELVKDRCVNGVHINYVPMGSCVVKPLQGTRTYGVDFLMAGNDLNTFQGRYKEFTLERFISRVRKEGAVYCQPFIPPMKRKYLPNMGMIYRLYFGFDCLARDYKPLGGVWMAHKDLLIHGRPDSISGPLLLV